MINILHIDDNPDDLELSKLLFSHLSEDVKVYSASNAAEAVSTIASSNYDCILCDYNMPDVDGLTFLQNLRDAGDETPFILLTGEGNEELAASALRNGADDYFVKKTNTSYYRNMLARIQKLNDERKEKRQIRREKQEADSMLAIAADLMREAILIVDGHSFTIRYCNKAVEALFGYSKNDLLGSSMEKLILSKIVFLDLMENLSSTDGSTLENVQLSMKTRSNDIVITNTSLHRLNPDDENDALYVFTIRDDFKNRLKEIALNEHCSALEKRLEKLSDSEKESESFIYTVSHDLKGHVNNIVEFSKIIEDDLTSLELSQFKKYLRIIINSGQRLRGMINGLLQLSKTSQFQLNITNVNLSEIADSYINEYLEEHPDRAVKAHVEGSMIVKGDEALLRSVVTNLLENALKFTADRERAEITFSFMTENNKKIFFVEDNGVGFNKSFTDKLFKPFQRFHDSSDYPGTGLGLAIVERIIERHNGKVWAESEEGEGTSIFFTLG